MNTILINVDFFDVLMTGLKVVRVEYNNKYTKIDMGFLFSKERKNIIKISDKISLKDYNKENKSLIECIGINLDEEIKLKSVKDFRYFSLKFEPFNSIKEKLMLMQSPDYGTEIAIITIELNKKSS